ncbi:ABC transporter ATP-binding protein [Paracoccus seriniphilus]|uniref:Carbohydrate ABC transporter ATP-binding protein, CUT1 family n=1 Tax=Paracoccus seriniphilus TaxID=184748 RepID=A0A239PU82_9RHOB|nr:ABC transporter ATP-binding protein [Paracoccus seriniphilus]WCR16399.1 ABC transporter ATP-binding protein [Paracoccus seriniphilus]SNT73472.1 carbohydrate ABC transporter ATP-binding protein, CUT1 family [Paracoccus seriniphilus]
MAELSFSKLTKTFDDAPALNDINAQIRSGEFVALLGPSGCGKTTLLRLTAGFEQPSEGEIRVDGEIVAGAGRFVPPEAREIGIVFQSYALWPHKTVRANVSYPLEVRRLPRDQRQKRVAEALALTGLTAYADRMPSQLSGGQRQRVALARCLVFEPRAVLLDEPLANLDLALRASMQDVFAMFHRRTGATMLYVTHDQGEALALADRVAVMESGRIRQFAAPEILYREPADCFVAGFVGDGAVVSARLTGRADDHRLLLNVLGQQVWSRSATAMPSHVSIRPEAITISNDAALRARVTNCTYLGGRFRLTLDAAGETLVAFAPRRAAIGEVVGVAMDDIWAFRDPAHEVRLGETLTYA